MAINIEVPGQETFNQRGVPDVAKTYQDSLANMLKQQEIQYNPSILEAKLQEMQNAAKLSQLNALKQQLENQYYPQKQEAEIKEALAHANYFSSGGALAGTSKEVLGLEKLRNQFGEDSPIYKQALDAYQLKQQNLASQASYRDKLNSTANKRYASALGKELIEQEDINQGFLPGSGPATNQQIAGMPNTAVANQSAQTNPGLTNLANSLSSASRAEIPSINAAMAPPSATPAFNKLSPDAKKDLQNKYALSLQKKTSDVDTRKRNLFAQNIDITKSFIDPDKLTIYSGAKGQLQKKADEAAAATGRPPERYQEYQDQLTAVEMLTQQARQFYGASIQPEQIKMFNELANPENWINTPEIAKSKYQLFSKILDNETKTYRDALKSTAPYESNVGNNKNSQNNYSDKDIQTAISAHPDLGISADDLKTTIEANPTMTLDAIMSAIRKKHAR